MTVHRTFVPVPPEERPVVRRRTARILLVNDRDELLLFADSDPGVAGSSWWITPGGGVDEGESDHEAAVREVLEETGAWIGSADLVGPVVERRVLHGYSDVVVDQDDVFFACWCPAFEVDHSGHTEEERLTMTRHRWWTAEELAATTAEVWPDDLLRVWAEAALHRDGRGRAPRVPPVAEESTVPVGALRAVADARRQRSG